jgi:hypothetical protein
MMILKKTSAAVWLSLAATMAYPQGDLAPSGPPAPSMKTLDQVEARIPISVAGYQIQTSGSYYLTTNLVAAPSGSVLIISADDVMVDLNGFSILGLTGGENGVTIQSGVDNAVVENGPIRDCYHHGIAAATANRCAFKNLRVLNNGRRTTAFHGLWAGYKSHVEGCLVAENNGNGLRVRDDSRVVNNVITDNGGDGLYLDGAGAYLAGNIVRGNGDNYHILAGNQLNLLICEIPETLEWPCSARLAGTLTCSQTGVNGINITSPGNLIIRNAASGNSTNYVIMANNKVGEIVNAPNSAAISGSTGGSGVGSTDPWANISF